MEKGKNALELDTRNRIYNEIVDSPGLHFRELQRRTTLAIGSLQYHLDYLQKNNLLKVEKEGAYKRYFALKIHRIEEEERIMPLLRQENIRKIILFLLEKDNYNHSAIVSFTGLSPSVVSFHLDKCIEAGIVNKTKRGRESYFSVINPNKVIELLTTYRKSFLDKLVDNFLEIWEGEMKNY
ncbi:MAG: winged helix-turn-helix transcriptional regulator [archaeon]|nr:winged helix-turn-helix transcriptional regulator [Candidatus Micrarchaeota archaeon]